MVIVIDFDGTCVRHEFPEVGGSIGAEPVLRKLVENGHKLVLFTMRSNVSNPVSKDQEIVCKSGDFLNDAVLWFKRNNIDLYGIQVNPTQTRWTTSPKAYGELIIDDAALGVPLIRPYGSRPYVDWLKVEEMLVELKLIPRSGTHIYD